MSKLLDNINSPADLKKLSIGQLPELCAEIRQTIIEVCSENPGHLASSLGAVELIVGMHYVFDAPQDKIVFDVGHQAYAHKILTGRKDIFSKNRTRDGISGFPNIFESEYDAFGVGHSSTAISAALGYAEAARIQGDCARRSIALVGDGAMSGGLAFEALNNAGGSSANLLVVLNDNNQSIDKPVGGLHNYLLKITTSRHYNRMKSRVWSAIPEGRLRDFLQRWIRSIKSWFVKKSGGDLFEALGLRYFGPIDGNDIQQVVETFLKLRELGGPRVVHCYTRKGCGFAPAESDPMTWHAPGKFDPTTGLRVKSSPKADRFQDVFGQVLCELADVDQRVVGITPAMASGCGMNAFASAHPDRFFDVGIEEEHAVTFSAGLAAAGMKPFCNIYSSFSQRAYDQIIHDVALQKLPVVLCFDRAGLVGEDGATHCGAFDMSAYRSIPNCIVSAPADEFELKCLMHTALAHEHGPFIIRYPRGVAQGVAWRYEQALDVAVGEAQEKKKGTDVAVIAIGPCVYSALEAASEFADKVGVYNFRFLKPLDTEMLRKIASSYKAILTVEDGALAGGLYGAVCEFLSKESIPVHGLGIPDRFIPQDRQSAQRAECGIDKEGISKALASLLS